MIRIAICDSDMVFCHTIMRILEKILRGRKYEIEDFSNGFELLQEIEKMEEGTIYQMIILEVDLPVFDGIKLGQKLRSHELYRNTMLIYISNYDYDVGVITDIHPFAYIRKDISGIRLREKLENYMLELQKPMRYIAKGKEGYDVLEPGSILYLESVNRSTIVHMVRKKSVELAVTLSEVFRDISGLDKYFLQTHKSFVVNSRRITAFSRNEVQLCGELWVPVSHGYRKQLKDAYFELFDTNLS